MPHPFELPPDVADRIIGRRGRLHVFDAATGRRVDPPAGTAADLLRP